MSSGKARTQSYTHKSRDLTSHHLIGRTFCTDPKVCSKHSDWSKCFGLKKLSKKIKNICLFVKNNHLLFLKKKKKKKQLTSEVRLSGFPDSITELALIR